MAFSAGAAEQADTLLNASYDLSRPNDPAVAAQFRAKYQPAEFIDVDQTFGGWGAIEQMFFADGGLFHRIWNR